jgi:hypothetical protein
VDPAGTLARGLDTVKEAASERTTGSVLSSPAWRRAQLGDGIHCVPGSTSLPSAAHTPAPSEAFRQGSRVHQLDGAERVLHLLVEVGVPARNGDGSHPTSEVPEDEPQRDGVTAAGDVSPAGNGLTARRAAPGDAQRGGCATAAEGASSVR